MMVNKKSIALSIVISVIIFIFYFHTLNYGWKFYDEELIFNETLLPIARNFNELLEIISNFGFRNYFEASNPFYSSISNLRCDPVCNGLALCIQFLFQKNFFYYHLFSLSLHIFNSIILFLLIRKFYINDNSNIYKEVISVILPILWALHPVNSETILLSTNWGGVLTCSMYIFTFYLSLTNKNEGFMDQIIVGLLLLISCFTVEYSVTLPFMVLFYTYTKSSNSYKKTIPLFITLLIFLIVFFLSKTSSNISLTFNDKDFPFLPLTFERIFWLSPQVIFNYISLIFFPINLSIDQTSVIHISKTLFSPYSIFCTLSTILLFVISACSFFTKNKTINSIGNLIIPFFIALLPFTHIISPIYNLGSERYLYLPTFFLIFSLSRIISGNNLKIASILLIITTLILSTRTYIRTLDWKDTQSLFSSSIETTRSPIVRSLRHKMIADSIKKDSPEEAKEIIKKVLLQTKNYFSSINENDSAPLVIKYYGLDNKTLKSKTAFLISLCESSLNKDNYKIEEFLTPQIRNLRVTDSLILNFYYPILFLTKRIDLAEEVLIKSLNQKKLNPILFLSLADVTEYKYKDLNKAEEYLRQSFSMFPFDSVTLYGLVRIYKIKNQPERFAYFSYLHGLRTHDIQSLQEAGIVYIIMRNKSKADLILHKLLYEYPSDDSTKEIELAYKKIFGGS